MMKFSQTANKVSQMMEIAFDVAAEAEKRETATSNLLVLAKENAGIIIDLMFFFVIFTHTIFK